MSALLREVAYVTSVPRDMSVVRSFFYYGKLPQNGGVQL